MIALPYGSMSVHALDRLVTPLPTATPLPAQLTIWYGWQGAAADALTAIIQDYQAAHANVQVTAHYVSDDLRVAVISATLAQHGPDLFIGPSAWISGLADSNLIAPLTDRISTAVRAEASDVSWQTTTYNGTVYALPENAQCLALFYNSGLVATPPTTFDTFFVPGSTSTPTPTMAFDYYTTAGLYFGLGGRAGIDRLVNANGQPAPGTADMLQQYLALVQKAFASQTASPPILGDVPLASDAPFRLGQSPYWIDGSWRSGDFRRSLKEALQVAPLPLLPNGKQWQPLVSTEAVYLSINASQPDTAFDFATDLLSAGVQARLAQADQTPVSGGISTQDEVMAGLAKQCAEGTALPPGIPLMSIWAALDNAVYMVTVGGQVPAQAAATTLAQIATAFTTTPTAKP